MSSDPFKKEPTAIIAIDPGGATGVAVYDQGTFTSLEYNGSFENQADDMIELFYRYTPKIVVCETYTITARTAQLSQQHEALMLIGIIRWLCRRGTPELVMQSPAQAKAFSTDAKLRSIFWHRTTGGGHANDAARHLLRYCADKRVFDIDTLTTLMEAV